MKAYNDFIASINIQTKQPMDRPDTVKNNAEGWSFSITEKETLERFLFLGTEGNTYYASSEKLTEDNAKTIIKYIKTSPQEVLDFTIESLSQRKAPKINPSLFVLALISKYGNEKSRASLYKRLPLVLATGTHLFTFVAYSKGLRGWGTGLTKAVASWYVDKSPEMLAYQILKYKSREGWSHKDLLKLSHPKAKDDKQNELFKYILGKEYNHAALPKIIQDYEHSEIISNSNELAEFLKTTSLSWEMVDTKYLNDKDVLTTLTANMPFTAKLRNLNRMSKVGFFDRPTKENGSLLASLLTDERPGHPINIVNSMLTYASGKGFKGNSTWPVHQKVVDVLHTVYDNSFNYIKPTNKNILVAVDISGSMNHNCSNMNFMASQISQALAYTINKIEVNSEIILFDTRIYKPKWGRRNSLDEVMKPVSGGGTDCSLAFQYGVNTKTKYDAIIILTDSETWAGKVHAYQALEQYRNQINKDVKVIEVALVANPYSTLPPEDKNSLRVVGFDASVIDVINNFIRRT